MKNKPLGKQVQALQKSEGKRNFAFIMDRGCGKTYTTLADAERCWVGGKIDALLVVCPKVAVHNWLHREIKQHMDIPVIGHAWRGMNTKAEEKDFDALFTANLEPSPLRVFIINIDAVNFPKGIAACEKFLRCFRVMMVVDESTRIKNPQSKRTKKVIELGRSATARRILSGTPLTKSPNDLFSQFEFLKPGLLGTKSYRAFVAEYNVLMDPSSPQMIGMIRASNIRMPSRLQELIHKKVLRPGSAPEPGVKYLTAGELIERDELLARVAPQITVKDQVTGNPQFRNLDRLIEKLQPHVFRAKLEDMVDMPPAIYQTAHFELNPTQMKTYKTMEDNYAYQNIDTMDVHSFQAIAARTKLRQITSGFINIDGKPVPLGMASNPRLDALKDVVEDLEGSFIIWCCFDEELRVVAELMESMGISHRIYNGSTKTAERETIIDGFQAGEFTAFLGNPAACGIAVTLTAAKTAVYYSEGYDYELRLQSEARPRRIGTVDHIVYIDLVAKGTIDEDIAQNHQMKQSVAAYVIDGEGSAQTFT